MADRGVGSELDLGIGYPVERREELIALLAPKTVFKGERVTRFPAADFRGSEPAMRIAHTWVPIPEPSYT